MTIHFFTFNLYFIPLFLIRASRSDNLSTTVPSSFYCLPSASSLHAEAISDEGLAIFAMARAIPRLVLLSAWSTSIAPLWHSSRDEVQGDEAYTSFYIEEQVRAVTQSFYHVQPAWCHFEGVQCGDSPGDTSHASVNSISLPHLGLSGTLPDSIGNFLRLTHFDVSHNHLSGTIPATVSNWNAGLRELLLSNNTFTGSIPPLIGTCYALAELAIDGNSLTGTIPPSICGMTSLTRLLLETNSLSGTVPMQMSQLTQLISSSFKSNHLDTGSVEFVHESAISGVAQVGEVTPQLFGKCLALESIGFIEEKGHNAPPTRVVVAIPRNSKKDTALSPPISVLVPGTTGVQSRSLVSSSSYSLTATVTALNDASIMVYLLLAGKRTVIDSPEFHQQLSMVLQSSTPGQTSSIAFSASYPLGDNSETYWLPCNLTVADGNIANMKSTTTFYFSSTDFATALSSTQYGITYSTRFSIDDRPSTPSGQPSAKSKSPIRSSSLIPSSDRIISTLRPSRGPTLNNRISLVFYLLLIGDSEVIGDSGYGPALTKILQVAVPGASPVDSLATAYVSAEYPYYYWLPCTVTRSNGDVSKMSDAITQYVKSEKMRANLTSAKLNVYNSGIVRISTKPLEKKEGVPSGAPTPFKSYILVGIDLVLNGEWDTINSSAFLDLLKGILKESIPGVSADDTFGTVYSSDQYPDSWVLPCYVRRASGSEDEIRKAFDAYADSGKLSEALSKSAFRITYANDHEYQSGLTEPPTAMPTLQPRGGALKPTMAPTQSGEGSVDLYLLIKGNIKTIESNDFLVKVDRVFNGMLPGEYKALNHGIAYASTEYPDYYWLPCFVVRSGATGAEITFKIVEYEKKGQLYTDMQNLKIDVTYTGLLSIGIRPPQGGSSPIVPTPQPSIAPTISRSVSPSIAPALFSTSLVRIAQLYQGNREDVDAEVSAFRNVVYTALRILLKGGPTYLPSRTTITFKRTYDQQRSDSNYEQGNYWLPYNVTVKNGNYTEIIKQLSQYFQTKLFTTSLSGTGVTYKGSTIINSQLQISPTASPVGEQSYAPTMRPTSQPSSAPTLSPLTSPTDEPSMAPTTLVTSQPSSAPTLSPSTSPTDEPSMAPTTLVTSQPSSAPTLSPSTSPTDEPSMAPTTLVTSQPSSAPTLSPSTSPTDEPSMAPTTLVTSQPSSAPTLSPSTSPTDEPSMAPTTLVTSQPSSAPTLSPSTSPTDEPSMAPTTLVTSQPSSAPTLSPSTSPTDEPSMAPTTLVTSQPSSAPTLSPSTSPTDEPSMAPTTLVTSQPSSAPTLSPSTSPTDEPSMAPTTLVTSQPSSAPTVSPSTSPTDEPSMAPTTLVTSQPSSAPTLSPSTSPTDEPSMAPTTLVTSQPSSAPTLSPSTSPTDEPSMAPTTLVTSQPSSAPTLSPSTSPTDEPSMAPTTLVTSQPSSAPTLSPSTSPTDEPSMAPTTLVTSQPSSAPTLSPSTSPTDEPSMAPTTLVTSQPSSAPTLSPSTSPTDEPSMAPTTLVTSQPSSAPTLSPSTSPTDEPSMAPTDEPSMAPTTLVTSQPSSAPTLSPSTSPTDEPSMAPTTLVTSQPSSAPTLSPSTSPTDEPSMAPFTSISTASPTDAVVTPVAIYLTATATTRSSIVLAVTLNSSQPTADQSSGGTVFCVALRGDEAPSSIGAIKSSLFDGSSSRGAYVPVPFGAEYPVKLPVTIGGLSAVQAYSVYCYAETSIGTGPSRESVLRTRVAVTTSCCRAITFTNSPAYVYSDVKKYTALREALFVFSYSLPSLPATSASMIVTPIVYENGVISRSVTAYPRSIEFKSTSQLLGHFYLSANSTLTSTAVVNCTVSLSLLGTSAALYSNASVAVKVLHSASPLPAPSMVSARISNRGHVIMVTFDSNTDKANIATPSWPCSELFRTVGVTFATCTWLSESVVSVSFPRITAMSSKPTYARTGDTFSLQGGLLRPYCTGSVDSCPLNPTAKDSSTTIQPPADPVMPFATVSAANTIGLCANLTLDATLSTGQGYNAFASVAWAVSATSEVNTAAVEKYLNTYSAEYQVSRPIIIMRSMLESAAYTFTLQLVNSFNLTSSKSVKVVVTNDARMPALKIVGVAYETMYVRTVLHVECAADPSACLIAPSALSFKWDVKHVGVLTDLQSMSRDPTTFQPRPNDFKVDNNYQVMVTAFAGNLSSFASVQVYVAHGNVTAAVVGGYDRSVPIDEDLVLDASISVNADTPPGAPSSLSFKWSCMIISISRFGENCGIFEDANLLASSLFIPSFSMSLSTRYEFTVLVTAPDGRSDSQRVLVSPAFNGSVLLSINSRFVKFNPGTKLIVAGNIRAQTAVTSFWSVRTALGVPISYKSLTPQTKEFPLAGIITYPMSAAGGTFVGGNSYLFRLTAYPMGSPMLATHCEIQLTANAPPRGGYLYAQPTTGNALKTDFFISTPGWTADVENLPLRYAFYFRVSSSSEYLTLAAASQRDYTESALPAGLPVTGYKVTLRGRAIDMLNSSSTTTSTVEVTPSEGGDTSRTLSTSLNRAFLTGDVNLAYQAINSAATTISTADCTASPDCSELNRNHCFLTIGTCGRCFDGFSGVGGDSNVRCLKPTDTVAGSSPIGSRCNVDTDCLYNRCDSNTCTAPVLQCPTARIDSVCSANGACRYSDPSGNSLKSCTISDVHCSALCVCGSGFGGRDCSLNATSLATRNRIRTQLCQAIVRVADRQDRSPSLLRSLVTSLLTSFSPYEITDEAGRSICSAALMKTASLSKRGYLEGSQEIAQLMANLISAFTMVNNVSRVDAGETYTRYPLNRAVKSLIAGVQLYMAGGEHPVPMTTPHMEFLMASELVANSANLSLEISATNSQLPVGQVKSKVTLGPRGLSGCPLPSTYAQLTVVQWRTNPYAGSKSVMSPLLRVSSVAQPTETAPLSSFNRVQGEGVMEEEIDSNGKSNIYKLPGVPAYTITLQYSSMEDFDFTTGANYRKSKSALNYTIPACRQYDGSAYVPCSGCDISSYTNYNVTYSCYDIKQLCAVGYNPRVMRDRDDDDAFGEEDEDDFNGILGPRSRYLQSTDDDGSSEVMPATYGMLVETVIGDLSAVLSNNPFARQPSPVVLTFVGCLSGFILLMLVYLLRRDEDEKMFKNYVKAESDLKARKLLERDIRTGSKGDRGMMYQDHLSKIRKESQRSTVMSDLSRTSRAVADSWYKKSSTSTQYPTNYDASQWGCGSDIDGDYDDNSDTASCGETFIDDEHCATEATITEFLHKLFPGYAIFSKKTSVLNLISVNHDYFKMFGGSNMTRTRTVRFLQLVTVVLVGLFVDTLFFGVFYPSDVCETHQNKISCTEAPSKVQTDASLCNWSKEKLTCTLAPPPNGPMFTIVVALLTIVMSIPIISLILFVLMQYASKQPTKEALDREETQKSISDTTPSDKGLHTQRIAGEDFSFANQSSFGKAISRGITGERAEAFSSSSEMAYFAYAELLSPAEETDAILERVRMYLSKSDTDYVALPWNAMEDVQHRQQVESARIEAIEEHLGMFPDGSFVPLSFRQRMFFGTPMAKLHYKVKKVRARCDEVVARIQSEECISNDERDIALLREFVLECLSPFKRYALESNNRAHDRLSVESVSWAVYISSWIFISGSLLFFVYWIFAWGVYKGDEILRAWGAVFGTGAASDIFLVQITKIMIVYYLPAAAMQSQLRHIREVLADVSMNYISRHGAEAEAQAIKEDTEREVLSVVQNMSAACRAARSNALNSLPAAWLLRQLDDVDAQRCRDGRLHYLGHISFFVIALPMTFILMHEVAGGAIIDAAIPAMYSAIFVLGAYLYSISLLALLLTFCLVIAAVLYWTLVYSPASKAHSLRKEKLKRMRSASHSPSVNRQVKGSASPFRVASTSSRSESASAYFRRVFHIMRHSLQHGITLLSIRPIRRAKGMALQRVWCAMNRVTPVSKESSPRGSPSRTGTPSASRHQSLLDSNFSTALATVEKVKSSRRTCAKVPSWSSDNSEFVVIAMVNASESTRRLTPKIIFDAKDVFALIRSRLFSEEFQNEEFLLGAVISEPLLKAEYRRALNVFYPDGVALSPTEIEEACELYDQWKMSVNDHFVVRIVGSTAVRERMIRLCLFEEWMSEEILGILRNNLTDRLMISSLQKVPHMRKRMSEASCIIKSAGLSSIEFRNNMKALNVVTPQKIAGLAE